MVHRRLRAERVEVDLLVLVRREEVREQARAEDQQQHDQAAERESVPEEASARVGPLAARLDLEAVLVGELLGGVRRALRRGHAVLRAGRGARQLGTNVAATHSGSW